MGLVTGKAHVGEFTAPATPSPSPCGIVAFALVNGACGDTLGLGVASPQISLPFPSLIDDLHRSLLLCIKLSRVKLFLDLCRFDMQISRWRNVLSIKTYLIHSPRLASTGSSSAFHSTPFSSQKWNNKSNSNHIRFVVHEKRSDAKKALKDLLYNSGSSKFSSQKREAWKLEGDGTWCGDQDDPAGRNNKGRTKSRRKNGKSKRNTKGKIRKSFCEDGDGPDTIFCARFGYRSSTWSFCDGRGSSFEDSTSGFDHRREREHSSWANRSRTRKWTRESDTESASDIESDDNIRSCYVGLLSDRTILGLPPTGPLKIEDVKNAFRLSALKWHPDKHQGPSQVMAEEKFKECMNAYKSLCGAISTA